MPDTRASWRTIVALVAAILTLTAPAVAQTPTGPTAADVSDGAAVGATWGGGDDGFDWGGNDSDGWDWGDHDAGNEARHGPNGSVAGPNGSDAELPENSTVRVEEGVYRIESVASDRVLDVEAESERNGTDVVQ